MNTRYFMTLNIADWSQKELGLVTRILSHLMGDRMSREARLRFDKSTARIGFNPKTSSVVLFDLDYNFLQPGVINRRSMLVLYLECPECGHAGAEDDVAGFIQGKTPGCKACDDVVRDLEEGPFT